MTLRQRLKRVANLALTRYGHEIVESRFLYDWQKSADATPAPTSPDFPSGALEHLTRQNPRLKDFTERYARFNHAVTDPSVWTDELLRSEDLTHFRGDNAYVWQLRGQNMDHINYVLTTYYLKSVDKLDLLERLQEDDSFGAVTFRIDDKVVSRDLLDSVVEISFLEKHLGLSSRTAMHIADVGAGYGRLAHRMTAALPNIKSYLCTDAVPQSTFISEYYLDFRRSDGRARVVPLDEIEGELKKQPVDLAVNIHSFSECTVSAIAWWLSLLARTGVKHLMIVPNAGAHGGQSLLTNEGQDFQKLIEAEGYKLTVKQPKYEDPVVQKYGLNPTYIYLFERLRG